MAKKLLKDWVYHSLKEYKNTAISDLTVKKFGEERILADLKKNGFNCTIKRKEIGRLSNNTFLTDVYYIIEVVKS